MGFTGMSMLMFLMATLFLLFIACTMVRIHLTINGYEMHITNRAIPRLFIDLFPFAFHGAVIWSVSFEIL
jgi:hypothetical protein